ncbi:MAG: helix-turn-helix transcriptional regulator [Clostridia bacterium]|nr:helix-turn-helix transcriptional regulator [Clostridia bacterium]
MKGKSSTSRALRYLICLFELICQSGTDESYSLQGGEETARLVSWIEQHFSERLTVAEAAAYFGYNKYYFCKWIRRHTGVSFSEFVNAIRINHACTLLVSGYSVEECAEKCGYYAPSYFIKIFKQFMKQTPKKYAEQKKSILEKA